MITEKILKEVEIKADEYLKKIPFEVYWDFSGCDKSQLNDLITLSFESGYMKGYTKAKGIEI